jgi:hypothetical protein
MIAAPRITQVTIRARRLDAVFMTHSAATPAVSTLIGLARGWTAESTSTAVAGFASFDSIGA